MTRSDESALKLAMREACKDPARGDQLARMLEDRDWFEVAKFAVYVCQSRSLKLMPWDLPPSAVSENDTSEIDAAAVKLLRRMLAAGVSRYHPDPLAALARR